jgi:hypothetical protein
MTGPPKEKRAGKSAPSTNSKLQASPYGPRRNNQTLCHSWAVEGRRLLREYQRWRTIRHYRAYLTHCVGIGSRVIAKGRLH